MVSIIYSDDKDRLSEEIRKLMQAAADEAFAFEFENEISVAGIGPADIDAEISVTIVEDEEIQALNRDYRGNDKVTDVLSFPQFESRDELAEDLMNDEEGCVSLAGDVVISFDQAARQAEEYGTGLTRELVYLFVHSIFHLFGYDHEDEEHQLIPVHGNVEISIPFETVLVYVHGRNSEFKSPVAHLALIARDA